MNNRLQQFLIAENISQSVFADTIGVARASVSHILAGRNKPGFDFIESLSRHYPTVNLEWLITGKGKMYKTENTKQLATPTPAPETIQTSENTFVEEPVSPVSTTSKTVPEPVFVAPQPEQKLEEIKSITSSKNLQSSKNQRSVSRIIILYNDGSYQELK